MRLLKHTSFDGISATYSKAYLTPELALIAIRRYRPRSVIEGWGYNSELARLQIAVEAKANLTHVPLDHSHCSCGLTLIGSRSEVAIQLLDLLRMPGHIDPSSRNLVTQFVIGENLTRPMSRVGVTGEYRKWCIYCGDLGLADFNEFGKAEKVQHLCPGIRKLQVAIPFSKGTGN